MRVIADFDDDDVSLAEEFRQQSLMNRAKLHPGREGSPGRLRRSQRALLNSAGGHTFSSDLLASRFGFSDRYLRVPHARELPQANVLPDRIVAGDTITVGFLGTMRSHKGLPEILRALRADPTLRFVTFRQPGLTVPPDLAERWRELDPATPLGTAYSMISVALVPMDPASRGACAQLPAKAIDAAMFGKTIVGTPTPVMREYFDHRAIWLEDWATLGDTLRAATASGILQQHATAMRSLAEETFTTDVVRTAVATYLEDVFERTGRGENPRRPTARRVIPRAGQPRE
ncbi:hypothetical protein [Microbacterium sp. zg.Y909]|uniref:hypothetical protein n=1 Tax=Microbacterium sp. zg.Y909 TaxID=2969413 RepID=UPI00214ACED4|nr:hypothetical protein [Microbacterium sp. zg.Y909]MCR2823950.1 hypothetical protein [Microbacterium sp. zg.Y909]